MRVKIIDEYNRIPTRTQSALLTVMGDNYAEMLDQIYECPEAAWYLTANDDAGGGTYQVIEALRDRIDIVVKALALQHALPERPADPHRGGHRPRDDRAARRSSSPRREIDRMNQEILRRRACPTELRRRLEFFASQFEFCEPAADQFEYKTKDTAKLAGVDLHLLAAQDTGSDQLKDLGSQTRMACRCAR